MTPCTLTAMTRRVVKTTPSRTLWKVWTILLAGAEQRLDHPFELGVADGAQLEISGVFKVDHSPDFLLILLFSRKTNSVSEEYSSRYL